MHPEKIKPFGAFLLASGQPDRDHETRSATDCLGHRIELILNRIAPRFTPLDHSNDGLSLDHHQAGRPDARWKPAPAVHGRGVRDVQGTLQGCRRLRPGAGYHPNTSVRAL